MTTGKLENLRETGQLSLGEFRVSVDVPVYCVPCVTQLSSQWAPRIGWLWLRIN